ncbi:hypothetical protein ANN_00176 [Periplaneta americana]|uniref:Uncharacterized protein n=1 Tax=Periplaneta americana TaxID=6978 RepID=A0ABQ8TU13_PERAM|nr:hypothetical protein ANN_00176 [Periplaneta americana]
MLIADGLRSHRPCWTGTKGKMTTFLDESSLWTKPGLAHTNQPNLKRQSNEWKHPGSSCPKKVRPTQSVVKVTFIVAYDIDGVILHHAVPPRQTANADYYCRFLQHHLRPALRRKRRHLVVQNPIILHDAVKDLLRRWQWETLEHPPPNINVYSSFQQQSGTVRNHREHAQYRKSVPTQSEPVLNRKHVQQSGVPTAFDTGSERTSCKTIIISIPFLAKMITVIASLDLVHNDPRKRSNSVQSSFNPIADAQLAHAHKMVQEPYMN